MKIILDFFHKRYSPYFNATYLPHKKEIRINRDTFFALLKDWDKYSDEQKAKQWKVITYLFRDK